MSCKRGKEKKSIWERTYHRRNLIDGTFLTIFLLTFFPLEKGETMIKGQQNAFIFSQYSMYCLWEGYPRWNYRGLPLQLSQKRICLQYRRPGFDPWVGKIPWRRKWATHSSILAWRIPWIEKPSGLQSMGSQESDMTKATKRIHTSRTEYEDRHPSLLSFM